MKVKFWLIMVVVLLGNLGGMVLPVQAEESIVPTTDLRIIKVQLRDTKGDVSDIVSQFVVIKNFGSAVDLGKLKLEIWQDEALKRATELTESELSTGGVLVLANNQNLVQEFLGGTELVQYFAKPDRKQNWLYISKGPYKIKLLHRVEDRVLSEVQYSLESNFKYDFISLRATATGDLVDGWQTFKTRDATNAIWLKASQLPLFENNPTPQICVNPEQELVGNKCLDKCPSGFHRQGESCLRTCNEDQEPIGDQCLEKCTANQERVNDLCLDKCPTGHKRVGNSCQLVCALGYEAGFTGTCVKQCEIGYYRNPTTNRCNKIPTEPAALNCQAGYYLNPTTNRCRKIPVESVPSPCPAGQYRHPETNRCRKLMFEPDSCKEGYEIGFTGTCVKKCQAGYERDEISNRCRKTETVCQDGFTKDPKTGICVQLLTDTKVAQSANESADIKKRINFDWLKLLDSPLSGAIAASIVFAVYDRFFRK